MIPLEWVGGNDVGKLVGGKSGHISANPRAWSLDQAYNGEYVSYYVRETRVPRFGPPVFSSMVLLFLTGFFIFGISRFQGKCEQMVSKLGPSCR